MILLRILDHDLHRSRNESAVPLYLETPARKEFLPALVSSSRGAFLVSRSLFGDPGKPRHIRSGVFPMNPESMDGLIGPMVEAALELSVMEKWKNVFPLSAPRQAFDYVRKSSGLGGQPHVCLCPEGWTDPDQAAFFGDGLEEAVYMKTCSVVPVPVPVPVFLSKPDMVGMHTQFAGGDMCSIIVHNIRRGMAFCHD